MSDSEIKGGMPSEAIINVRMPERLKRSGVEVLRTSGVTATQLIRGVYDYLEREKRIPECLGLGSASKPELVVRRRSIARSIAGTTPLSEDFEADKSREERIERKYGGLL